MPNSNPPIWHPWSGEERGEKLILKSTQVEQSTIPVGNPSPLAVGEGDMKSRCINVDPKLGEKIPVGNKNDFH